jgi:antitoxin StbD
MNEMMQRVDADLVVSISNLKKNPSAVFDQAGSATVAVLNHNRVVGYLLSPDVYEAIMEELDDHRLSAIIAERRAQPVVEVAADDL